ncbi:MAG: CopG family antitoxin [Acidobacteria bacterium]|nr:CopG family antitoxin [Acidobacteriota bacterium]
MSTTAQLLANQQNAARSTGPRTPEGKAASAANSTSHGLTGSFRLLPGEDIEEFRKLLAAYDTEFDPAGGKSTAKNLLRTSHCRWRGCEASCCKPAPQPISLRLPPSIIEDLKVLANNRDVPYQSVLKGLQAERLQKERRHAS